MPRTSTYVPLLRALKAGESLVEGIEKFNTIASWCCRQKQSPSSNYFYSISRQPERGILIVTKYRKAKPLAPEQLELDIDEDDA